MKKLNDLSLNMKIYMAFGVFLVIAIVAGVRIMNVVAKAKEDASITNVLGRQRMLTVEMIRETLAGSAPTSIARIVDQLVSVFRGVYTHDVIGAAKSKGLAISMTPDAAGGAIPFPATLVRKAMEKFKEDAFPVSIIAEKPINPAQTLKDEDDRQAWSELKKNPKKVFMARKENILKIYTADLAIAEACASCHNTTQGTSYAAGDMLGIRRFDLRVSGKDPLAEYQLAKDVFAGTLKAAREGGMYFVKISRDSPTAHMPKIDDTSAQTMIGEIEKVFMEFTANAEKLSSLNPGSQAYDDVYNKVVLGADNLLVSSNKLTERYGVLADKNQGALASTLWISAAMMLLVIVLMGWYFIARIVRPIEEVADSLKGMAEGNLRVNQLQVDSSDEIGVLGTAFNGLLDGLKNFISHSGNILKGETHNEEFGVQGDFKKALDGMLSQAKTKKEADVEMMKVMAMVENMPMNVMYADTDFKMKYVNPNGAKILKSVEQFLPVRVDNILGQSVDVFHKDKAMIRKLISDPRNLPYATIIDVGPEKLDLQATAIYDKSGQYLGPMVTWNVVTAKIEMERKAKEMAEREKTQAEDLKHKVDSILDVVTAAAKGDLTREITVSGSDSMGQMGQGLGKFFGNLRQSMSNIGMNANALAGSSEELTSVSQQMAGNAEETAAQAGVVSAASEQVSRNVETVATGTEEMSASIKEISKNASEAARVATNAVKVAATANSTVAKLGASSAEIGEVIKVINSIAEQTNLLALNATIEAARAGEAGKGFAVVAGEVKELAKETSKATEDISRKIQAIQADTTNAVEAIGEISKVINQVNDIANTIASAVEEQAATTSEMGRNVTEAAKGSSEIAQNITGVAQAAQSTTQGATDTQKAAAELSRMASELQGLVGKFKC